ncbi:hypothetical protein ACC746_37230, partial [Rhizobium ruizarguesonis]
HYVSPIDDHLQLSAVQLDVPDAALNEHGEIGFHLKFRSELAYERARMVEDGFIAFNGSLPF